MCAVVYSCLCVDVVGYVDVRRHTHSILPTTQHNKPITQPPPKTPTHSFIGHAAGIVAGGLHIVGLFDWLRSPYWALIWCVHACGGGGGGGCGYVWSTSQASRLIDGLLDDICVPTPTDDPTNQLTNQSTTATNQPTNHRCLWVAGVCAVSLKATTRVPVPCISYVNCWR